MPPSLIIIIDPDAFTAFVTQLRRALAAAVESERQEIEAAALSPWSLGPTSDRSQRSLPVQGIYAIPGDAPSDEEARTSLLAALETCTPIEIVAVRTALRDGALEGCSNCACGLAHIALCRGQSYEQLREAWGATAIEQWVQAFIHFGLTPENDAHARLLDGWLTTYLNEHALELRGAPLLSDAVPSAPPSASVPITWFWPPLSRE